MDSCLRLMLIWCVRLQTGLQRLLVRTLFMSRNWALISFSAIELMGHDGTDPSLIPLLMEQCKAHGFSPFHVKRDSTGYIYNRFVLLSVVASGLPSAPRPKLMPMLPLGSGQRSKEKHCWWPRRASRVPKRSMPSLRTC